MSAYPPNPDSQASGRLRVKLPSPFAMQAGGALHDAHVAVETWGELSADRDNGILLFTGLSASAHAAANAEDPSQGWWQDMIGAGKPIDTRRFFVICVNSLGSCFGSTGPGDPDPATGRPYDQSFPELRVEDIARASQAAVEHFGIERLAATVGASLGGMTVLAHAALFPGRMRRMIAISGALAPGAGAIGTRALQREIVGTALAGGSPSVAQAMKWARKVGVLSYIGAALLEQRFARRLQAMPTGASGTHFEVESWLEHQAEKFAQSFYPWAYWSISRAMDLFDFAALAERAADPAGAAARLRLDAALVIGVHEDLLFPLVQQQQMAATLRGAGIDTQLIEFRSPYGHDAFLVEPDLFGPVLSRFLRGPEPRKSGLRARAPVS
jgi:homoserine O-acetyltransferase/O-succinyltransferase